MLLQILEEGTRLVYALHQTFRAQQIGKGWHTRLHEWQTINFQVMVWQCVHYKHFHKQSSSLAAHSQTLLWKPSKGLIAAKVKCSCYACFKLRAINQSPATQHSSNSSLSIYHTVYITSCGSLCSGEFCSGTSGDRGSSSSLSETKAASSTLILWPIWFFLNERSIDPKGLHCRSNRCCIEGRPRVYPK